MVWPVPVVVAYVGVLLIALNAVVLRFHPSRLDLVLWKTFTREGNFTREQVRAASAAIRNGKFTTDDPLVRTIMLERARYLDSSGVAIIISSAVLFSALDATLSLLYLVTPLVPVAIVAQSVIAVLLMFSITGLVGIIRNARKFLAPWWAT